MTKDDEQSPIGLLLCADKDEETVYFATGGMENDIRVSRYKLELPSEEELRAFLKREQQFIESQKGQKER
jgi:serine/threonine-protein kinase RIO1